MDLKLIRTIYEYKIPNKIKDELDAIGYLYTVKLNDINPDGIKWYKKDEPNKEITNLFIKKKICKILNIDSKKVISIEFKMGVMEFGADDNGKVYYCKYLKNIILKSEYTLEKLKLQTKIDK